MRSHLQSICTGEKYLGGNNTIVAMFSLSITCNVSIVFILSFTFYNFWLIMIIITFIQILVHNNNRVLQNYLKHRLHYQIIPVHNYVPLKFNRTLKDQLPFCVKVWDPSNISKTTKPFYILPKHSLQWPLILLGTSFHVGDVVQWSCLLVIY